MDFACSMPDSDCFGPKTLLGCKNITRSSTPRRMMVLLLLRYSRMGPISRLSFMQFFPGLAAHGIDVEVAPLLFDDYLQRRYTDQNRNLGALSLSYFRRLKKLAQTRSYDLIWLEKEAFPGLPAGFELMLFRKPVVLDLDD